MQLPITIIILALLKLSFFFLLTVLYHFLLRAFRSSYII